MMVNRTPVEQPLIPGQVQLGIDVLEASGFSGLEGKRVGLITNHTGLTRDNRSTIDVLHETPRVNLVALYSPEHGIRGTLDTKVTDGVDEKTGLPILSLYGATRKPTPEMLKGIDVLVFDIQDIGTRFYTYIGTMALAMQAAAELGIEVMVLDRPNPIGGHKVEGKVADASLTGGITAIYPIPTRHGMTVGELALLFNEHFKINCKLTVVEMRGWRRAMYYDQTGLLWVNPSPNMKTLNGAIAYPGMGSAEATAQSPGRGTDRPFEMYGSPWVDGRQLAAAMNANQIPGVHFVPYSFTPTAQYHKFKDEPCNGVFAVIYDREAFPSVLAGLHLVQEMYRHAPDKYTADKGYATLTGSDQTWTLLTERNLTPAQVLALWQPELDAFLAVRENYLIYP
jgi:uncharacterized protein YbbC (DUF1343 family)